MHRAQGVKKATDRGNEFGALLTNLYKVLNYINQKLLIAKICNNGVPPLSTNMTLS